jgi:hypothetical protein
MKIPLTFVFFAAPALALAHDAPFGHQHASIDGARLALGLFLAIVMGAAFWAALRRR